MNLSTCLNAIVPKVGWRHFTENFLTWFGVGFAATLLADLLDRFSGLGYASYYTRAINDAVGYQFWVLLAEVSTLLFCISLPLISLAERLPALQGVVRRFRAVTYTFFLVAFDEGALMIGILCINFVYTGERVYTLASKSFLFSDVGLGLIMLLAVINAFLWLLGEAIYNREDQSVSGVVQLFTKIPLKWLVPAYLLVTGGLVYSVVQQ